MKLPSEQEMKYVETLNAIEIDGDESMATLVEKGFTKQQAYSAFTSMMLNGVSHDLMELSEKNRQTRHEEQAISGMTAFLSATCLGVITTAELLGEENHEDELKGLLIVAKAMHEGFTESGE